MFKQKIKSFILILLSSLLISACDTKSSNKIIEYQEEVKLSDGSFIWVDIKRHYYWSGWSPGMSNGAYMPSIVEISWDTGFPNVGRQSVFFDENLNFIDKIDGMWYVVGQVYPYDGSLKDINSVNCRDVGVLINTRYQCVFRIDNQGIFTKNPIKAKDLGHIQMNILNPTLLKDNDSGMQEFLDKTRLSWSDKLGLQQTQPKGQRIIGVSYSYDFINSSNGGEL